VGVVQRAPLSILSLLGMKGIDLLPDGFSKIVVPTLDVLQAFGATSIQTGGAVNAASTITVGATFVPSATDWVLLFAATGTVNLTATMTSGWGFLGVRRNVTGATMPIATGEISQTSAVAGTQTIGGFLPYPLLCPPRTIVSFTTTAIGTDPTTSIVLQCEYGLLS